MHLISYLIVTSSHYSFIDWFCYIQGVISPTLCCSLVSETQRVL